MEIRAVKRFLVTNFFYAPDISDRTTWKFVQEKIMRDFPWLVTEQHHIWFSGIGQNWSGWRKREQFTSHARFKSTPFSDFNALLAWVTHFSDTLRLADNSPLVILAPTPESGVAATLAKSFVRNPVRLIVRVQGHTASKALYIKRSAGRFSVLSRFERFVLRRADLIVPMGKFTCDLCLAYGARPERTMILPFPVRWSLQAEITDLPESATVLFVGRLEKEKGVHVLLKAMVLVKKAISDARLVIAGDGAYRPVLEPMASSLGLRDVVSFLGWLQVQDLMKAYREARVVVLPSIWEEGLGMVLVEAGLMGRPVVASDIGGIRDVVRHRENGLLVPPGDATALAEAIVAVLRDRDLGLRMGYCGSRIARGYLEGREEALGRVRQAIDELLDDGAK